MNNLKNYIDPNNSMGQSQLKNNNLMYSINSTIMNKNTPYRHSKNVLLRKKDRNQTNSAENVKKPEKPKDYWKLVYFFGKFLRKIRLFKMERYYELLSLKQVNLIGD